MTHAIAAPTTRRIHELDIIPSPGVAAGSDARTAIIVWRRRPHNRGGDGRRSRNRAQFAGPIAPGFS
jgi:hypothetical protein